MIRHSRRSATNNTHPHHKESQIIPALPSLSTLRQLRRRAHRRSPPILEDSNQTPEMNHRQRDIVKQETRHSPEPRVSRSSVWVAGVVVHERVGDADAHVVPVEVGEAAAGEEVIEDI
jgi:hypothetical protein